MGFNLGNLIFTIIMIIVTIQIAAALDTPLFDVLDNVTGEGFAGTAILAIIQTLYWLLISAVVVVEMILGFGLADAVKKLNKINF